MLHTDMKDKNSQTQILEIKIAMHGIFKKNLCLIPGWKCRRKSVHQFSEFEHIVTETIQKEKQGKLYQKETNKQMIKKKKKRPSVNCEQLKVVNYMCNWNPQRRVGMVSGGNIFEE